MNIRHLINQLQEIVSKHGEEIEVGFKDREPTYFTEAMYVDVKSISEDQKFAISNNKLANYDDLTPVVVIN